MVIDFGIGHQRQATFSVEGLIPGFKIDDGETSMHHAHVSSHIPSTTIRPAMGKGLCQRVKNGGIGGGAVQGHETRDSTHQRATFLNNLI